MSDEEPKIIIDEDWKAQAQREKAEAEKAKQEQPKPSEGQDGPDDMPQASFMSLVTSLATQTLFALGAVAQPDSQEVQVDVAQAKLLIDMLMMLRDKTQGNLDKEEEAHLGEAISELQRLYSVRAQQMQEAAMQPPGAGPVQP